jgi:site-specific DNA-methyltransferase (adenine-specific)
MGKNNKLLGESEYTQKFTNYPSEIIEFGLDDNFHPTQKPVDLMEYLIRTYSNEGDTVLDNCMGSGTTGVAAKKTNRNFIGMELDSKYFEYAEKRINNFNKDINTQTSLF